MLQTCPSTVQGSKKLLLSISAALREEVKSDALLPSPPPSAINILWQRPMALVQAAQKQGGRPQDAAPSSTARALVEKEFGADLEFHALRLNSTQDEAMLDPQSGFDGLGTQERWALSHHSCSRFWN